MYFLYMVLMLVLIALAHAGAFYFLFGRTITYREALRINCAAIALNKIFFSGTGFVMAGSLAKNKNISWQKVLGVFLVLEGLSVIPWLIAGCFFGITFAAVNAYIVLAVILFGLLFIWIKREKFRKVLFDMRVHAGQIGKNIVYALPCIILEMFLFFCYYVFLFQGYALNITGFNIFKIVAVSFSAGYLSPAPSGLGFKDAALAGLLLLQGVAAGKAAMIMAFDRLIIMVFWLAMGFIAAGDLLYAVWCKKFAKNIQDKKELAG